MSALPRPSPGTCDDRSRTGGIDESRDRVRVLYSFPHRLGADRICTTAWQQVRGLAQAGAEVIVCPGASSRPLPPTVIVRPTLARGKLRVPYRLLGSMRAFDLHDRIVARRLERLAGAIDIVHVWPLGALRTLQTAIRLGIPTVLERPNAHTRFAYEVVQKECERLGVVLPANHEHKFKQDVLAKEEAEYRLATRLLCPSDFVAQTFVDEGFPAAGLARHRYGFDERVFFPRGEQRRENGGLAVLFVGGCAPRKGLHFALEAWLKSTASTRGRFTIVGEFVPGYAEKCGGLSHPSVRVLGQRSDVPELMAGNDVLILPSIEEGSALVTSEARGSGCVLLVSEAAGAICKHMENALVHRVGDVAALTDHLDMLDGDPELLKRLRDSSLSGASDITWTAAGRMLLAVYRETIAAHAQTESPRMMAPERRFQALFDEADSITDAIR